MKTQTARRPDTRRPSRSAKVKKYTKQTAHVEARRDGKPLILGWGGHLSRTDKVRIQRYTVWSGIIFTGVLIVAVVVGFWVNNNIVVPNQPITSVNGQAIPQVDYHKLVSLKAQLEVNKISGQRGLNAQATNLRKQTADQQKIVDTTKTQIVDLNKKITALPAGPSAQRTDLESQLAAIQNKQDDAQKQYNKLDTQYQTMKSTTIPNEQVFYTQSQIGNDSATWLQDDALIRNWLAKQSGTVVSAVEPSASAVNRALNTFKAEFPKGKSYDAFLSSHGVSDSDIHAMMALKLRRDNMQIYQASQITSPAKQIRAAGITLSTTGDANGILAQLKKGGDFTQLAKDKSVDTASKAKGGELGWLARGQYTKTFSSNVAGSGTIDNWLFNPARKVGDTSPVLNENGTYHVLRIEELDPARVINDAMLKSLKTDALTFWLLENKIQTGAKITAIDQDKLLDPMNMPQDIPTSPPQQATPGAGLPGGGGAPGAGGGAPGAGGGAGQPVGGTTGG